MVSVLVSLLFALRSTGRSRTVSGGWRIIHTMGSKITKLQPVGGFAAETAGAISLSPPRIYGVPVSTTHRSRERSLAWGQSSASQPFGEALRSRSSGPGY